VILEAAVLQFTLNFLYKLDCFGFHKRKQLSKSNDAKLFLFKKQNNELNQGTYGQFIKGGKTQDNYHFIFAL